MSAPEKPQGIIRRMRTLSDLRDQNPSPHRLYMRISALEMEKKRKGQERDNAMLRVQKIDRRLAEIDLEIDQLLHELDLSSDVDSAGDAAQTGKAPPLGGAKARSVIPQSQMFASAQKFVIKY